MAGNAVQISVDDQHLMAQVKQLESKVQAKVLKASFRKGLQRVRSAARQRAKKRFGFLKKSLDTKVNLYDQGDVIWGGVGVAKRGYPYGVNTKGKRKGTPKVARPNLYAHLIHDGFRHRGGRQIAGDKFLESAWKANDGAMLNDIKAEMQRQIDRVTGGTK